MSRTMHFAPLCDADDGRELKCNGFSQFFMDCL